ncbi:integrase [Gilliamella sp. HK2]|uniref:tyrosine-type recombinase/integrase n=1 Tax=unclassified Gilliamella TaxID=2685620 RepID=UPI00080E1400|nr:site-specific integrase [Gilliamella apicola]OCG25930.1 integrase [Gilliamella apicola]OCG30582.1 integrase [Gilliamella apicola]
MALSDTKLKSILNKPYTGLPELTDGDGLGVRISQKGTIAFQFRYRWNGKAQRMTIGRYPSLSLKDARILVGELRDLYNKGIDPKKYNQANNTGMTLKDCLDYWMEKYVSTLRNKTATLYQAVVCKNLYNQFPDIPVNEIPIRDWVTFFEKQEQINLKRARTILVQAKSAINWCISRQVIDSCELMKLSPKNIGVKTEIGDRVLTYKELAKIWLAIENSRASTINKLLHQMLMLWGARNSELRLATVSEFDMGELIWTVPKEHSKMGNVIRRPIFEQIKPMVEKLQTMFNDKMFPGTSLNTAITISAANRYVRRLREKLDMPEWSSHDFRRTLSTRLSEEGVMPHITERMLGHELGGVMAVYNKHDWIEDQRKAYELYADKILWHIKHVD